MEKLTCRPPKRKLRVDRVSVAVVGGNYGRVIGRNGDIMQIGSPADISIGLARAVSSPSSWGIQPGLAPRRVIDMNGNTVVCDNDPVTTSYYTIDIDLAHDTRAPAKLGDPWSRPSPLVPAPVRR